MPSYGSSHSPSLQKVNAAMDGSGRRGRRRGGPRGFRLANIFGDPFALATISIAILAWIIAFVAQIIASVSTPKIFIANYVWWATVYFFFCILAVTLVVAWGAVQTYHVAIVGYMAAGLILSSAAVDASVGSSAPAQEASAAGHILLAMISVGGFIAVALVEIQLQLTWSNQVVWIFYFGSTPEAAPRSYVDSFALHKDHHGGQRSSRPMTDGGYGLHHGHAGNRPETSVSGHHPVPQMYTSAQLNGFETSSPVTGYPGGPVGVDHRSSLQPRYGGGNGLPTSVSTPPALQTPIHPGPGGALMSPIAAVAGTGPTGAMAPEMGEVSAPTEYPYRAKAIYSYEANPEDANEISFSKHEILEVSDVSGRWWQAKKEGGETGIAPSNYLILL
ncbi:MAG: Transmembrane osmosensor [Phylliscum demangeonii]|nr:MAG: Transmembrane osmosensor [Phylliscum demangeonii]